MTRLLTATFLVCVAVGPATHAGAQSRPAAPATSAKLVPRLADGHPDLNGYWKGMRDTVPVGNIAKDLPGLKLPLTPAGDAAWKHNTTATIDPESLCIPGGIPQILHSNSNPRFVDCSLSGKRPGCFGPDG